MDCWGRDVAVQRLYGMKVARNAGELFDTRNVEEGMKRGQEDRRKG